MADFYFFFKYQCFCQVNYDLVYVETHYNFKKYKFIQMHMVNAKCQYKR